MLSLLKRNDIGEPPWEYDFLYNLPESEYPKYLAKIFNYRTGEKLPLRFDLKKRALIIDKNRCKTFNQKIQWLKLYGVTDLMSKCTDKVAVRDYVRERIGEEYLKPVLQIIPDGSQQSSQSIESKSASIEDLPGNPLNKGNNVDCHADTEMVSSARNDMRSVESIRLSVIANVTTSNTGNVWQSRENAEIDEIATEPKTPSFYSNDSEICERVQPEYGRANKGDSDNEAHSCPTDSKFKDRELDDVTTYFDQINWEKLPNAIVIKCNHGCKWQYIIKNKNLFLQNKRLIEIVKRNITGWLEQDYSFFGGFEMQYSTSLTAERKGYKEKGIEPKILIEPLMRDEINAIPREFEIYCFKSIPKILVNVKYRNGREICYYDENFNYLDLVLHPDSKNIFIQMPADNLLKEAVYLSKELSKDFSFVRIDWMIYKNKLYFNELTFTPYSGLIGFHKKWELKLGSWIDMERYKNEL